MVAGSTKKIVISGYYGFQNSGDEAVLQSILLALEQQAVTSGIKIDPIVLSANPQQTTAMYGVRAIKRTSLSAVVKTIRQSDGLISGGGSLLQDVTGIGSVPYYLGIIKIAQWLGKPTFIYAQGIGPVRRRWLHWPICHVFERCEYVSVRDEQSKQFLQQIDMLEAVELVADPVMALTVRQDTTVVEHTRDVGRRIGVSLRSWKQSEQYLVDLAQVLNHLLADEQVQVTFLPFHLPDDEQPTLTVIEQIQTEYRHRVFLKQIEHPQQMLAEVGKCELLIGMRLHSLIYAANQGVPLVGISYDPKIDQFLARIDMKPIATTERIPVDEMIQSILKLFHQRQQWQDEKKSLIHQLRTDALKPAKQIVSYFVKRIHHSNRKEENI